MASNSKSQVARPAILATIGLILVTAAGVVGSPAGYEALDESAMASARGANREHLFVSGYDCSYLPGPPGVVGFASCVQEYVECVVLCQGLQPYGIIADEHGESYARMTYTGNANCGPGPRWIGECKWDATLGEYYCDGSNPYIDGTCTGSVSQFAEQVE